jgi:hypothetical protein
MSYAQRIKTFLVKDPQVRQIVGENWLTRSPALRDPLPAVWCEDVAATADSPAIVRLHVYAAIYQQAKSLIRTIVGVLEYFEDDDPRIAMETDDYTFDAVKGRVKIPGDRIRFELVQDLEIKPDEGGSEEQPQG